MDMTFANAELAALCNSERRLTRRWGPQAARTVGRRLLELAAADELAIGLLPRARVHSDSNGGTVIDFGAEVIIRGTIAKSPPGNATAVGRCGRLMITSIEVHGSEQS